MPKLIIEFQGQEWAVDLREGANIIGRAASCTSPIKDPQLSREHCEVRVSGSVATVLDKGSMNGTLVNGSRVQEHRLQPGDKVVIGHMTAWYEVRKAADADPSTAPVDARANTRRTAAPPPVVEGLPPDYTLGGRITVPWSKMGLGVLVLAILGAGAFAAKEFGGTKAAVQEGDKDNLIRRNASFELAAEGKPVAWSLRGNAKGTLAAASQGRTGSSCMALEKSAGGGDAVLECAYGEEFPLGRSGGVDASAWARYDGLSGWAAIKVDWLKSVNGPVVAEEVSAPAPRGAGWIPVQASFTPPADAGAFRVALAAVGRSGRLAFDDVSVRLKPQGAAGREHRLGTYRVAPARDGTLRIETRGRRSLVNFHARLESNREGSMPQSCARDVAAKVEPEWLGFKGKMVSPVDFKEIDFEELVAHKGDELKVIYVFPGGGLRQVDRLTLAFVVPRVDRLQGLPEAGDKMTNRISFRSEEGEVVVEYSDPVRVRVEQARGGLRVVQSFAVDPSEANPDFWLVIREAALGYTDPLREAAAERIRKRFGVALEVLQREMKKAKDPVLRDRIEGDIRQLEEVERREWAEAQSAAFQAILSRRVDLATTALEALDRYQAGWGEAFASKAEPVREKAREVLAGAAAEEAARHKLILDRAKQHAAGGRKTLAGSMTRALLARHPGSAAAEEAKEFLKGLSEP